MANQENIAKLIEAIKTESVAKFDMDTWVYETGCGTIACIGGTVCLLAGITPYFEFSNPSVVRAGDWLGIAPAFADELFYGVFHGDLEHVDWLPTASDAIAVLRDIDNFTTWQDYYDKNVKGGA